MIGLRGPRSFHWLALALGLACGFVLQAPHLLFGRVHDSMDWVFHYSLAREYAAALDVGDWRPRWAFGAQSGLGDPAPFYYAPLYYMAVAWLSRLTGNVWLAMQGVEIAAAALMGVAVFALAARYVSPKAALSAVPIAIFSPMLCLLHTGFNAYPWACALAPLAALQWVLLRPGAENRVLNLPAIAALAATIAMHVVTGLMAVIAVGALVLRPFLERKNEPVDYRAVAAPIVTILFAVLLSAAYLYPAFSLQSQINPEFLRGLHNPLATFSLPVVTAWLFDTPALLVQWPVSFLLVASAGLALWRLRPIAPHPWLVSAALMIAAATLLASEISAPLWLIDTPLRNVQFPFRFMTILIPLVPVLIVSALARGPAPRALLTALTMASVALALVLVYKASVSDGRIVETSEATFPPYRGLEEYRTRQSLGATQRSLDWHGQCARTGVTCGEAVRGPDRMTFPVTATAPARIVLPVYAFPAWTVSTNGAPSTSQFDAETGLIAVDVPRGANRVTIAWKMMPAEKLGIAILLAAALLLILAALLPRIRRR